MIDGKENAVIVKRNLGGQQFVVQNCKVFSLRNTIDYDPFTEH